MAIPIVTATKTKKAGIVPHFWFGLVEFDFIWVE